MRRILLLFLSIVTVVAVADAKLSLRDRAGKRAAQDDARIEAMHKSRETSAKVNMAKALAGKQNIKPMTPMAGAPAQFVTRAEETHPEKRMLSNESSSLYSDFVNVDATLYYYTYSYDEYGFLKEVKCEQEPSYGASYTYTWLIPGKAWSERATKNNQGEIQTVTYREYYPNGNVSKQYVTNGSSKDDITQYYEFNDEGYVIKSTIYGTTTTYVYFAPTKQWFESREDQYYAEIYEVVDNGLTLRCTRKEMFNDSLVTRSLNERYYTADGECVGDLSIGYDFNGEAFVPSYGYGYRTSYKNENNEITEIRENYQLDSDKWIPEYKRVESANSLIKPWRYVAGATYYTRDYNWDNENNTWKETYYRTYSWVNDRIIKYDSKYWDEDPYSGYMVVVEPEYDDDEGLEYVYYDPKTGNYAYSDWDDDDDCEYYFIYKLDGTLLKKYREKDEVWNEWNGSAWVACSGTITVYEDEEDWMKLTFDDKGRLVKAEEYEYDELDEYAVYTYPSDLETFVTEYESDSDKPGEFYKNSEMYTLRNSDGTEKEYWEKEYEKDGSVYYAYKRVYKSPKLYESFNWSNGEWVSNGWSRESDYETLADGTEIIIDYSVDEAGIATPRSKYVNFHSENSYWSESYDWDATTSSWVGVSKDENYYLRYSFTYKFPGSTNPLDMYDYFVPKNRYADQDDEEREKYTSWYRRYSWDAATNAWIVIDCGGQIAEVTGNKLVIKNLSFNYDTNKEYYGYTIEYVVNDKKFVVSQNSEGTNGNGYSEKYTADFNYDADGDVTKIHNSSVVKNGEEISNQSEYTNKFTYGNISVLGAGINETVTDGSKTVVAVYNLNGVAVTTDNLPAGIYIVKYSDGSTTKVIMK